MLWEFNFSGRVFLGLRRGSSHTLLDAMVGALVCCTSDNAEKKDLFVSIYALKAIVIVLS